MKGHYIQVMKGHYIQVMKGHYIQVRELSFSDVWRELNSSIVMSLDIFYYKCSRKYFNNNQIYIEEVPQTLIVI